MAFQISPGVNVSEIDLTTIVPAVATTEAGIAGHFRWGPVNTRVLVTDESSLVSNFKEPNANTADDFFTASSFLAYGNQLWVTRVVNATTEGAKARNATSNLANTTDTIIKNGDDYSENYNSGISNVGDWVAKYPGELGNSLRVSVCPSASAWQSTLTGNVAITTATSTLTGNNTFFDTELSVGDLVVLGPSRDVLKVSAINSNTSVTLSTNYTGNTISFNSTNSSGVVRRWEYFNFFDNAPGTSAYATVAGGSNDELHVAVVDEDGEWTGVANQLIERFEAVSFASDAKTESGGTNYYKEVINQQSKFLWWAAHNSSNVGAGGRSSASFTGGTTPQGASLVNGRDGVMPTNNDFIAGYNQFLSSEDVDVSFILGSAANTTRAIHLVDNIADERKDVLICLSPERADVVNNDGFSGSELEDVISFRNTLPSTSYAVMDSGWKRMYDKYNDVNRWVPLNGDTAGTMVRTDILRDAWWSPAGFNRGQIKNVLKLSWNPNKAERDQLYKNGINPIVTFAGEGTVLFGDKTLLAKPSAFDRINVRRLFIVLEKAISTAAKFTLFEFNDEFTRAQFRNLVEPFLRDVQGRRGIFDYRVVCDTTNNTPEIVDRNEFVGDIYIKPARSINFIQLNFVAVRTGVDFEEIVGKF